MTSSVEEDDDLVDENEAPRMARYGLFASVTPEKKEADGKANENTYGNGPSADSGQAFRRTVCYKAPSLPI